MIVLAGHAQQFVLGVADDLAQRAVDLEPSAVGGDQGHADGGGVERPSEPLLAQPQRLGGLLLLGDDAAFGDEQDDPADLVRHRLEREVDR